MIWIENNLESWMVPVRKINYHVIIFLFSVQVLVVFSQVIWRFVFNDPFPWSEELARYLQVWIILLTSTVCIQKSKHLAIDYLTHRLSFKLQRFPVPFKKKQLWEQCVKSLSCGKPVEG